MKKIVFYEDSEGSVFGVYFEEDVVRNIIPNWHNSTAPLKEEGIREALAEGFPSADSYEKIRDTEFDGWDMDDFFSEMLCGKDQCTDIIAIIDEENATFFPDKMHSSRQLFSFTTVRYEVVRSSREIFYRDRHSIKIGCTAGKEDDEHDIVFIAETESLAKKALKKYQSNIQPLSCPTGEYYLVEEYYLEKNTYDQDGEPEDGSEILEFSKFEISVVEKPTYDTLATVDNMKEAENIADRYTAIGKEVYISFN